MTAGGVRAAEALLRGTGGRAVLLRMPQPAVAGVAGEQLGLAQPGFQDVELGPAGFRRVAPVLEAAEMLVSAAAVARVVGSLGFDAARTLFRDALGVVVDEDVYEIEAVRTAEAGGTVYLYRIQLRGALRLVI